MIHRIEHKNNFTIIDNGGIHDTRLSLATRGIFIIMLSLPDDWDFSIAGLSVYTKIGKKTIQSALKELEKYGYLIRRKKRNKNGYSGWEYDIYETPTTPFQTVSDVTVSDVTVSNVTVAEGSQQSTIVPSTDIPSTDKQRRGNTLPNLEEIEKYCKERNNGLNAQTFFDYYTARDWTVRGTKIKDWKACVRIWEQRIDFVQPDKPKENHKPKNDIRATGDLPF